MIKMGNIQFEESNPSNSIRRWIEIANNVLSELDECKIEGIGELKDTLQQALDELSKINLDRYLMDERVKDRVMKIIIDVKNIKNKLKEYIDTNLKTIRIKIDRIKTYKKDIAEALEIILKKLEIAYGQNEINDIIPKLANRVENFLRQVITIEEQCISEAKNMEQDSFNVEL